MIHKSEHRKKLPAGNLGKFTACGIVVENHEAEYNLPLITCRECLYVMIVKISYQRDLMLERAKELGEK